MFDSFYKIKLLGESVHLRNQQVHRMLLDDFDIIYHEMKVHRQIVLDQLVTIHSNHVQHFLRTHNVTAFAIIEFKQRKIVFNVL